MTPIPGCSGEGQSGEDYCYDPNTAAPNPIGPSEAPMRKPTYSPTVSNAPSYSTAPTGKPTTSRSPINKVYEYYTGTTNCDGDLGNNDQGPEPGEDDTVLKFLAYGTCFYVFLHNCAFILRAGSNVCFTHGYYHDIQVTHLMTEVQTLALQKMAWM